MKTAGFLTNTDTEITAASLADAVGMGYRRSKICNTEFYVSKKYKLLNGRRVMNEEHGYNILPVGITDIKYNTH